MTAPLAAPLCAAAAFGGFATGPPWRDPRLRGAWPAAAAVAVAAFAVYAAPSVLSGQASITGYVKLDDSAIWLGLTDRLLDHGRDLTGLGPSSYRRTLETWLGQAYPVGAFVPVGMGGRLTGQDVANAYQPAIAVVAAILAVGLFGGVKALLGPRLAAAAAVLGVQASLSLGYAQWGGIKEITLAALLVTGAGLAATAQRRTLPLVALVAAALVDTAGVVGTPWAALGLVVGVASVRTGDSGHQVRAAGVSAALLLVGCIPVLAVLGTDVAIARGSEAITGQAELGRLLAPLELLQGAGLWPAGHFHTAPPSHALAVVLAVAGLLAAGAALAVAARRRDGALVAVVLVTLAGGLPALAVASPWVDAKLLAIIAPALLTATAAGVGIALRHGRRWRVVGRSPVSSSSPRPPARRCSSPRR